MGIVNIEPTGKHPAVSMSNRQFALMKTIRSAPQLTLNMAECAAMNQLTLGSLARTSRQYVVPTKKKDGVTLTRTGELALRAFENADFFRRIPHLHFSAFIPLKVTEQDKADFRRDHAKKKNKRPNPVHGVRKQTAA